MLISTCLRWQDWQTKTLWVLHDINMWSKWKPRKLNEECKRWHLQCVLISGSSVVSPHSTSPGPISNAVPSSTRRFKTRTELLFHQRLFLQLLMQTGTCFFSSSSSAVDALWRLNSWPAVLTNVDSLCRSSAWTNNRARRQERSNVLIIFLERKWSRLRDEGMPVCVMDGAISLAHASIICFNVGIFDTQNWIISHAKQLKTSKFEWYSSKKLNSSNHNKSTEYFHTPANKNKLLIPSGPYLSF